MFSSNYRIIEYSLYKFWKMPKNMKKETGVIYKFIIQAQPLFITRHIHIHSILCLYATLSLNIISQYIMSLKLF